MTSRSPAPFPPANRQRSASEMNSFHGSEALQWLDRHMVESLETPDEAFDWVFMLKEYDWPLLESLWSDRTVEWREALAYVLHNGPVLPAQPLLVRALFDADNNVAMEAAATLAHHKEVEANLPPLSASAEERLQQLLRIVT